MRFSTIIGSSIFQILSFLFVLVYLLGVLNVHFSDKNDYCVMTYMYEYPQYVRITVPENTIFPQYGLHAYSEGRFTERARKMWFEGVPVLFLPGNSGSHMQARSLASVALRKALSEGHEYHFDFFTISFNEELSGLYGGVLDSQTQFAAASITTILKLYGRNKYTRTVPNSVILIGHSMGGLIAKRLLTYPSTINTTSLAIALAAPLKSPVVNFDTHMSWYYDLTELELSQYMEYDSKDGQKKVLLSFGSGPRDVLIPSGLTASKDSFINALTTAIPGVWVSPDHVGIVWCKQLVMAINRFLFDIVDPKTNQVSEDQKLLRAKARQYFQANRSITLNPEIVRPNVTMLADAFWYEDNRRIYQISRPEIDKTTYLMIRLVKFPQNRFVAVEAINAEDKDWIFGCNAQFAYNTYRYCKQATSLSELSRWTGSAADFGKRKLATVQLHSIAEAHPDWSHVIVKVTPTRRPIVLTVDINDYASRQITVNLPSIFSFEKSIVKEETEQSSLYYEVILPGFSYVHQAYLLYVEPTASCKANYYHVSAEVHVPWAVNNEYFHYFTHLKRSPMKLRLYENDPEAVAGNDTTEHVKVTLLLDPQCTFTISISTSWYHRLAQFARNYSPTLVPYMAAILLLAASRNFEHLRNGMTCISIHKSLMSQSIKPCFFFVLLKLCYVLGCFSLEVLSLFRTFVCWKSPELHYFIRSILVLPVYMIALGLLNIAGAVFLAVMVFSSQLAHRLLFRIMWRGGTGMAEKVATGLQKVPMVVSAALVCVAQLSCGAASLAAGAAFYAFMISKMYEEYLEDCVYKLMAKVASKMCRLFKSKNKVRNGESETNLVPNTSTAEQIISDNLKAIGNKNDDKGEIVKVDDEKNYVIQNEKDDRKPYNTISTINEPKDEINSKCKGKNKRKVVHTHIDEQLSNLNFHMLLFFMWLIVTLVNIPVLLTWARNFKYSMALKSDTSYQTGFVMSVCSTYVWQMNGPRKNLIYYEFVAAFLCTTAFVVIASGPFSLAVVNYTVTFVFAVITLQQIFDAEEPLQLRHTHRNDDGSDKNEETHEENNEDVSSKKSKENKSDNSKENLNNEEMSSKQRGKSSYKGKEKLNDKDVSSEQSKDRQSKSDNETSQTSETNDGNEKSQSVINSEDCECNENNIYNAFKNLREKYGYTEE